MSEAYKNFIESIEKSLMPEKSHFSDDQIKTFIKQNLNYVRNEGFSDSDLLKIFIKR